MNYLSPLAVTAIFAGGGGVVSLFVSFLIFIIIAALVWWVISVLPLPDPFKKIVTVVFVVMLCLVMICWLCNFSGHPLF